MLPFRFKAFFFFSGYFIGYTHKNVHMTLLDAFRYIVVDVSPHSGEQILR